MSEEEFSDVVWEALKTETSDLRRQQRIIKAFQATRPAPKADGLVEELQDPWLNNPNDTERGPIPEWCSSLLHRAAAALKDRDVVLEEAARVADDIAHEWGKRWQYTSDKHETYDNGRIAGWSDGAADVAKSIRKLKERV